MFEVSICDVNRSIDRLLRLACCDEIHNKAVLLLIELCVCLQV